MSSASSARTTPGERLRAAAQPHRRRAGGAGRRGAEARQHAPRRRRARPRCDRRDLERRAPDLGLQLLGRAAGDDLAVVDDRDAVGQDVGLLEVLRGEEHRHALVAGEVGDLLPHVRAAGGVQAGRRLVEEEDPRAVHERQREVQPALHAARVAADLAVGRVGEPDALDQLVAARACARPSARPGAWSAASCARAPVSSGSSAASCSAAPIAARTAGPSRTMSWPATRARARGGRQQRGEHQHGGRLAGAVGAQEAVDLAGLHAQVDAVDGARPVLELADEALDLDAVVSSVMAGQP